MSADLRFIPDTAQADPDIFALQRLCDALSDAGLSGSRHSYKEQDLSLIHI